MSVARCSVFRSYLSVILYDLKHIRCVSNESPKNLYAALGLKKTATSLEIKKAYYDLTLKYHPDRNENCEEAARKFREVTEAYEILGNYRLKKRYDKGLPLDTLKKIDFHVEHQAKYQEFYDRRSGPNVSNSMFDDIDDLGSHVKKEKKLEEETKQSSSNAVQIMLVIFMCTLLLLNR